MKKYLKFIVLLFIVILFGCSSTNSDYDKNLKIIFIDVGQADAILFILPNDETVMIDAGYGYDRQRTAFSKIESVFLNENLNTIDHFIITHNHADHYGYIPDILENYEVKNFYGSGSTRTNYQYYEVMNSIDENSIPYYVVHVKDKIINEKELVLQVCATQQIEDEENPNFSSVMVKLTYKNTSYFFAADGGSNYKDAEEIALNSNIDLKSDLLKVGHHGSSGSTSETFLNAISPKYAILTTMDNSKHGLPTSYTINKLISKGIEIYQTKDYGNITVISDGNDISITTEKTI